MSPSPSMAGDGVVVLERKTIMPGESVACWQPTEISTLLGSCVSACLWDSRLKIGGMNHFMLPDSPGTGGGLGDATKSLRYGLYAMERLINDLLLMGAKRDTLVAKVFGGANITGALNAQHVGRRNADFVTEFLWNDKIKTAAADLGGEHSRRIKFNTHSGAVRVERVASADSLAAKQERAYRETLQQDPVDGDIVFF
ncbi:chemoreceptor glutamine deamidase CheD [Limnobacter sp.]|uniref:chemoreceptor glutamine deamidase CheD n=1 Tax=Limnobacter sp. TaxID=2003368 RepID=UPI003519CE88